MQPARYAGYPPGPGSPQGVAPFGTAQAVQSTVAILAPLTGPNTERGQSLVQAAQLALAAPGSPTLIVKDTGGTPEGAAAAATQAIAAGAVLLIGPLTGPETAAAAGPAQRAGVGMLAFTNDPAQSRPGVWPLGITPGQQVRRLVVASTQEGRTRFAALLPQNAFGNAMASALAAAATTAGTQPPTIRRYGPAMASMNGAVRDLSGDVDRRAPLEAELKAARSQRDANGRRTTPDPANQSVPPPPFDALLLADTGDALAQLASLLPYYDINRPAVRVLGPILWAAPATRAAAGSDLQGAWYAAPDPAARTAFDQAFQAKYGSPAPGLADVAYDAASIARVLSQSGGFSSGSLTRPDGYAGVDGVLALNPDGSVRRGLAIFEIQPGGAVIVQPAPDSVSAPGV